MSRSTGRWILSSRNRLRINIFQVTVCEPNSNNNARGHNSSGCEHNSKGWVCAHVSYGTIRHNSSNNAGGHNSSDSVDIFPVMRCVDLTKSMCEHIFRNRLAQFR